MEVTDLTPDAGNGNEPPKLAVATESSTHPAHGWLDTLVTEFHVLDEVMMNRLQHIVAKIRETL